MGYSSPAAQILVHPNWWVPAGVGLVLVEGARRAMVKSKVGHASVYGWSSALLIAMSLAQTAATRVKFIEMNRLYDGAVCANCAGVLGSRWFDSAMPPLYLVVLLPVLFASRSMTVASTDRVLRVRMICWCVVGVALVVFSQLSLHSFDAWLLWKSSER